jgi:hypothetical protein
VSRVTHVEPEFVELIPEKLDDGRLYVSMLHATVVHRCCCGCGSEVVTPLTPNDWQLTFDGETISLSPSIGNWSFACQSHYWIRRNLVTWAPRWSKRRIAAGRARDRSKKTDAATPMNKPSRRRSSHDQDSATG